MNSILIQDAICRRLEIIGEAASKIDDEFKEKYPDVPWHKIVGMRNLLIHEYFHVDLDQVWNTIQKSIPELKEQILKMYK